MSIIPTHITPELYEYYQSIGFREHPILGKLQKENTTLPQGGLQSAPEVAHFMAFLVQILDAKRVLELGTFTGYSALAMALALPEGGHLTTCDKQEITATLAQDYWKEAGVAEKITLLLGEASETIQSLEKESFDLIFIDANKRAYDDYYEHCLTLVRPGGLIALDNTLRHGEVIHADPQKQAQAIKAINAKIHQDPRVSMIMLPMSDGVTLVRRV